jgi:hypothetical protein
MIKDEDNNNNNKLTKYIDNGLYNFFKDSFEKSLVSLTSIKEYGLPYLYYQGLALQTYATSTSRLVISVLQGESRIVDLILNKGLLFSTVTLLKPTLIVFSVSLIYALVNSISQYGFEKVTIFVKDKSLSLIINVKDNSKDVLNQIIIYMNKIQEKTIDIIINTSIILITLYFIYKKTF